MYLPHCHQQNMCLWSITSPYSTGIYHELGYTSRFHSLLKLLEVVIRKHASFVFPNLIKSIWSRWKWLLTQQCNVTWRLTHQGAEGTSSMNRNGEAISFDTTGLKVKRVWLRSVLQWNNLTCTAIHTRAHLSHPLKIKSSFIWTVLI